MFSIFNTPDEVRNRRLQALIGIFQKTNRILSGKQVTCSLVKTWAPSLGSAPAWTQGTKISFADREVGAVDTAEDIVRLTGLNHHELGHVMFTPNIAKLDSLDQLRRAIETGTDFAHAFNILEDQRQESLMVSLWPSLRHYLTAMFVEYILDSRKGQADHSTTFLLTHGRRYLGSKIRDALRAKFTEPYLADDFADVIDRFRVLDLFNEEDRNRAVFLVQRYLNLLRMLTKEDQEQAKKYQHVKLCNYGSQGSEQTEADKQRAQEASEGVSNGDDDRDKMSEPGGQGEGSDGDDDASSNGDGNGGEGDGEGEDSGQGKSDSESWRSPDKAPSKSGGYTPGNKNRQYQPSDNGDEVDEAFAEALNEIMNDPVIQNEIAQSQRAMKGISAPEPITVRVPRIHTTDTETVTAGRKMGRKLQAIVEQQDPGWVRRTPTGKLNVARAMGGRVDPDEMFDSWDEGNSDAASVEGAILLDVSDSMHGHGPALRRAAWALKNSFDAVAAPCTIYQFSSTAKVVYEANERAKPGQFPHIVIDGGTTPDDAVQEAARRLIASKRKKRVFIVMTDGVWGWGASSEPTEPEQYIKAMTEAGVITVMAFLPAEHQLRSKTFTIDDVDAHYCSIKKIIKDLPDLVSLTNTIVQAALKQRR